MESYNVYSKDVTFFAKVIINKIIKPTTAQLFKDLKSGDTIIIQTSLLNMNMMNGAPICRVFNNQNGSIVEKSAKQIYNCLKCFEYTTII